MSSPPNPEISAQDQRLESFYSRAVPRMLRTMIVASLLALIPAFWFYRGIGAIGVAAGAAVSYVNFRALSKSVEALAERVVNRQSKEKGRVIVFRFLVRYSLVAIVAYAIFKSSALAFRGFLWGLCLPVVAMMIEAAVEAWAAFRR